MIKVECDFSAVQKALSRLNQEVFETGLMTATQEIARELHKALLNNTPVVTGNLRSAWSAGENLAFIVERIGNGFQVTLVNDARAGSADGFPYAKAVNDGHSTPNGGWVMGRFFVQASEAQTEPKCRSIVNKNLNNYFKRWLSGQ